MGLSAACMQPPTSPAHQAPGQQNGLVAVPGAHAIARPGAAVRNQQGLARPTRVIAKTSGLPQKWDAMLAKKDRRDRIKCILAALGGDIKRLQKLHMRNAPWDGRTTEAAAVAGHANILQYLRTANCPMDERATAGAALTGQLGCLQFLHESGCIWDEDTCANTLSKQHLSNPNFLKCLQYAHTNGCPWDYRCTVVNTPKNAPLDPCVVYARSMGCRETPTGEESRRQWERQMRKDNLDSVTTGWYQE